MRRRWQRPSSSRRGRQGIPAILAGAVLVVAATTGAAGPQPVTTWDLAGGRPVYKPHSGSANFRVTSRVLQLDSRGAEFQYKMTPDYNSACSQDFLIGWQFLPDVATVHEGEEIAVSIHNWAGGEGLGPDAYQQCFRDALSHYGYGSIISVQLIGGSTLDADYHGVGGVGSDLFGVTLKEPTYVTPGTTGAGRLLVKDTQHEDIGTLDTTFGNFWIEIGMGGLFLDYTGYLYDGRLSSGPTDPMGRVWTMSESGWDGIWTRRGDSNVFDAVWTSGPGRITAVLTITVTENQVHVSRRQSSDGNDCDYTGTIGTDGRSVAGAYTCTKHPGPFPWSGRITG